VAPEVADTSVDSDLLHSLDVTSDSGNQAVDDKLGGLAGGEITLSVHEPIRDLELLGVVDDSNQLFDFFVGEGTGSAVDVNFRLLADKVGEALANTNNLGHGKHSLALTIDVGVQHTENVLKLRSHHQALMSKQKTKLQKQKQISHDRSCEKTKAARAAVFVAISLTIFARVWG
jgi:hypothetical protein